MVIETCPLTNGLKPLPQRGELNCHVTPAQIDIAPRLPLAEPATMIARGMSHNTPAVETTRPVKGQGGSFFVPEGRLTA